MELDDVILMDIVVFVGRVLIGHSYPLTVANHVIVGNPTRIWFMDGSIFQMDICVKHSDVILAIQYAQVVNTL